jgi:hypothetical protein
MSYDPPQRSITIILLYYDLQVTYNEVGYSSYVYSDPYSNWADDEMTYMISNVVLTVG